MSELKGWCFTTYEIGDQFKLKDFHQKELKLKNTNNIAKLVRIEGCWCYLFLDNKEVVYRGPGLEIYWDKIS